MRKPCVAIGLLVLTRTAIATPEAATWHRQTLIGENRHFFFRYVAVSENPASYYYYDRSLRIEKVRKSDLTVVEKHRLLDASYSQDSKTELWTEWIKPLPSFDLSGFLRLHAVHIAFAEDLVFHRTFAFDSAGVWEVFEDGRVHLASSAALRRQIPDLGDEPRVAGIETTDFKPPAGTPGYYYLRIQSNSAAQDVDWSEDLLLVPAETLH